MLVVCSCSLSRQQRQVCQAGLKQAILDAGKAALAAGAALAIAAVSWFALADLPPCWRVRGTPEHAASAQREEEPPAQFCGAAGSNIISWP